jgi:hypothetical protein
VHVGVYQMRCGCAAAAAGGCRGSQGKAGSRRRALAWPLPAVSAAHIFSPA